MYGYIYLTKDLETNLIYIGQKKSSKFLDKRYLGSGTDIRNLINGGASSDRFEIKMIDTADSPEELNYKEAYWIEKYDSMNPRIGYNRCYGGITNTGFKQSDYQKSVASDYMKNRTVSDETRARMRDAAKVRTLNRKTNNGYAWMTNYQTEFMADSEEVLDALAKGFVFGRIPKSDEDKQKLKDKYANSEYMIKDGECILVSKDELDFYLNNGWTIGRNCYTASRSSNISKSKSGTVKIINPETLKCKYVKPEDIDKWLSQGFIRNTDFKKNTL